MAQYAEFDASEGDNVGLELFLYILYVRDVDLPQILAVHAAQRVGDLETRATSH
jgi:hypothetical protein